MISSQQLGERLGDARKRAGLTQAEVADRVGLARTTLVAIEKGERRPSNAELVRLGEVLKASMNDLLRETLVRAQISPRFLAAFGGDGPSSPLGQAVERLRAFGARYAELERLHRLHRIPAPLETLRTYRVEFGAPAALDERLAGVDAARTVRSMLGLGDEPARFLDDRLESEAGLRIFYLDRLPESLAAFLIWSDEIGACVAVNADHPVERRRWSLAHEVGHLLRDPEAGDVLDDKVSSKRAGEAFPESFATELLLPAAGVQNRFADKCRSGRLSVPDLAALARYFGVSFRALVLRLEELHLLPRGIYARIIERQVRVRAALRRPEPPYVARSNAPSPRGKLPERYIGLAVAAYDQELLSEGELAAYLDTDIADARSIYQDHQQIRLEDGAELSVDFSLGDLRIA
jgi:Zn-dependent peptidase ImmA (M78 family)/DNA-binding XRE family transcriptional regulator